MDNPDRARRERARARSQWPVRRYAVGAEPDDGADTADMSAEERLAMMWELALQAWTLSGRPLPDYSRRDAPGRVLRSSG